MPFDVKITTITVCASLGSRLDLDILVAFFEKFHAKYKVKYTSGNKRAASNAMFFNSFSFRMKIIVDDVRNNVNVKVFKSGSIQITGCRSTKSAFLIPRKVFNIIRRCPVAIEELDDYVLKDVKNVMLNSCFNTGRFLNRMKLFEYMKTNGESNVRFDPEKYHGVILKHKGVNFFFFHTGNVIMSSKGDDLKAYNKAYRSVVKMLETYPSDIFV